MKCFLLLCLMMAPSLIAGDCLAELVNGPKWLAPLDDYFGSDFNVISFANFNKNSSGDVEGRVAVRWNATFGSGFSIGYALWTGGPNATDYSRPWSLVVGENLYWGSGDLYPEGNNIPFPGAAENMFVGLELNVPFYLAPRRTGGPCTGCLDPSFDLAYTYYRNLSDAFAMVTPNVNVQFQDGGIFLSANDRTLDRYYIQVDADMWSKAQWFSVSNMNVAADMVVTITGSGNPVFSGGNFPGIPEKTVFNIPGNRVVYVTNEATGSFLAPDCGLKQTGGDEVGFVIVGDILEFVEARKPNCPIQYCCKYCPIH